jgi:nucleoid DNA-binding protein
MDKPISLSVKDYLIRKMSVKLLKSEKVIESVINHQFNSANGALLNHNSLELSGFGKLLFNMKKAQKKLKTMYSQKETLQRQLTRDDVSEKRKETARAKLISLELAIDILKPKVYVGLNQDLRGVEEQVDSPSSSESIDRNSLQREDCHLSSM